MMKRFSWRIAALAALLIAAALIMPGGGMTAVADTSGDWEYTVEGANCVVTKYTGTAACSKQRESGRTCLPLQFMRLSL